MKYRHIVSITGLSGLYQLISTKSNGAFVKSLEDLSNKFVSSRSHQVTPLESIEIYTTGENIHLHEVLEKLKSVDEALNNVDYKNNAAVSEIFGQAVPEFDRERVYVSDIKKIFKWYQLLKKNELLDFTEYFQAAAAYEAAQAEADNEADEIDATDEKPAKKAKTAKKAKAAKSADDATDVAETSNDEEEKPAKKAKAAKKAAPKKKKDEEGE